MCLCARQRSVGQAANAWTKAPEAELEAALAAVLSKPASSQSSTFAHRNHSDSMSSDTSISGDAHDGLHAQPASWEQPQSDRATTALAQSPSSMNGFGAPVTRSGVPSSPAAPRSQRVSGRRQSFPRARRRCGERQRHCGKPWSLTHDCTLAGLAKTKYMDRTAESMRRGGRQRPAHNFDTSPSSTGGVVRAKSAAPRAQRVPPASPASKVHVGTPRPSHSHDVGMDGQVDVEVLVQRTNREVLAYMSSTPPRLGMRAPARRQQLNVQPM